MARPIQSKSERVRGGMRAVALMSELAWHVGAENPHQFAGCFDRCTGMDTQASGKWRLNFSGDKPLSVQQIQLLSRLRADASHLHESGPADLWLAMWGDARHTWRLCRTRLSNLGPSLDDRIWSEIANEFVEEKTFDVTLVQFEGDLLLAEAYGEPLRLRHLTEAVTLYRLYQELNAVVPLEIDGSGICRCVRMCLDDRNVVVELRRYGVLEGVRQELAAIVDQAEAQTSAMQRWDALTAKLRWIG